MHYAARYNQPETRPYTDPQQSTQPVVVPEGHVFVLGDSRNDSVDSHVFGFLDKERIVGRVVAKFAPEWTTFDRPTYQEMSLID